VSDRASQEISEEERRYSDGRDPALLDVIELPLKREQPNRHQTENHVIDDRYYWEKRGTVSWKTLKSAVETVGGALWLNGFSSKHGENDRLPEDRAAALPRSLYLVHPEDLTLVVASEGGDFGPPRKRIRARFEFEGHSYCLVLTDPVVERLYLREPEGDYESEDAILCVSLAESFHGDCYKLAAAVITKRRAEGRV
jgi:hypothetical protein